MSGRPGVSLIYPEWIMNHRLLHFATNFQATSILDRAEQIIALNGLVAIKAHIVKGSLDGMVKEYRDYLHELFCRLEDRFGESLWWTSMVQITARCLQTEHDSLVLSARQDQEDYGNPGWASRVRDNALLPQCMLPGETSGCSIGRFYARCMASRPLITSCCPKAAKFSQARASAIVRYCCPTPSRSPWEL